MLFTKTVLENRTQFQNNFQKYMYINRSLFYAILCNQKLLIRIFGKNGKIWPCLISNIHTYTSFCIFRNIKKCMMFGYFNVASIFFLSFSFVPWSYVLMKKICSCSMKMVELIRKLELWFVLKEFFWKKNKEYPISTFLLLKL